MCFPQKKFEIKYRENSRMWPTQREGGFLFSGPWCPSGKLISPCFGANINGLGRISSSHLDMGRSFLLFKPSFVSQYSLLVPVCETCLVCLDGYAVPCHFVTCKTVCVCMCACVCILQVCVYTVSEQYLACNFCDDENGHTESKVKCGLPLHAFYVKCLRSNHACANSYK
jgi:hypothetical protein